jgi:hypothetical protein
MEKENDMKLFSDNFPEITTDADFVALKKKFPAYDAGYICQGAWTLRKQTREWMEIMWTQYEPYADPHFLSDFKRQFTQRSWELYLGATLLNRGLNLGTHQDAGADFDVRNKKNERIAWIEAIAVRPGDGTDKVPELIYNTVNSVPVDEMVLRVTNALDAKYKKYLSDLKKGLVENNEPYVIALDRSELGYVEVPPSLILKALFGVGDLTLSFPVPVQDETPMSREPHSFWSRRSEVLKKSGQPVSMTFFENPDHAGISAVIYSVDHVINNPRTPEHMGENFIVVHNPQAANPLTSDVLPFGDEYRVEGDDIKKTRKRKRYEKPDPFEYLEE